MKHVNIHSAITLLLLLISLESINAQDWRKVNNLEEYWKFSIGDNPDWAETGFDDDNWENVYAPSSWEDEGFYGYNGYAWYRNSITIKSRYYDEQVYLFLGYIDDVDEVYLNGQLIGFSGSFPPDYETAYDSFRRYPLPRKYINYNGRNVIAVRVYDSQLDGGIVAGDLGVYVFEHNLDLQIDLSGLWKFKTGDNSYWKDQFCDDTDWSNIIVPGFWELQGFRKYDGFAWYRKKFFMQNIDSDEKYILAIGKIDDVDEVYLNGTLIGSTGDMEWIAKTNNLQNYYQEFRGYYIPKNLLNENDENVIAVKVYDGFRDGGIYEGPVGIAAQSDYIDYWNKRKRKGIFDFLFGD